MDAEVLNSVIMINFLIIMLTVLHGPPALMYCLNRFLKVVSVAFCPTSSPMFQKLFLASDVALSVFPLDILYGFCGIQT